MLLVFSSCIILAAFVLISDHPKVASAFPKNEISSSSAYTTKYDNIDVDSILQSRRLLLNYVNCLLEKGPCTADGKELKKYVPDALATNCAKCNEVQKKIAGKVFSSLLLNYRSIWDELTAKYDPDGNFRKNYESADEDYSNYDDNE